MVKFSFIVINKHLNRFLSCFHPEYNSINEKGSRSSESKKRVVIETTDPIELVDVRKEMLSSFIKSCFSLFSSIERDDQEVNEMYLQTKVTELSWKFHLHLELLKNEKMINKLFSIF